MAWYAGLGLVCAGAAAAQNTVTAYFDNLTGDSITVSIDGYQRCALAADGSCEFQMSTGQHSYRVDRGGQYLEKPFTVPESWTEVCMHLDADGLGWDDCGDW